jgi:deoxyribodipyrimidine photolyase-related protein
MKKKLPDWFWTGRDELFKDAINQSLKFCLRTPHPAVNDYGKFCAFVVHPDEIDAWYLGIYIDAIEWVRDYQYSRNEPIC